MKPKKESDSMKLTFLGTSHGVPAADRFTSCYLLEVGERLYIFDAGAPVVNLLLQRDKDVRQVKAFFCSHFHGDHIGGGITMLNLFDWYYKETNMDAYLPDALSEKIIRLYGSECDDAYFDDGRIRLHVMQPGVIFDDGTVKVTAIPVEHIVRPDKCAYAFAIEAEGKHILYTGDMSHDPHTKDFPQVAFRQHFDLILSECAHFSVEKLAACMDRVDTDIFSVTHIFPLTKIDELRGIEHNHPFRLHIAQDGDEIEL